MYGLIPFSRRHNEIAGKEPFTFGNLFEELFNDSFFLPAIFQGGGSMKADIRETEKDYIIEAELPGIRKEEIKLDFTDDTLTIKVERNDQQNEEKESYIRKERRYGSFSRSFYVENVKHEDVSAKYEDGILKVTLPKAAENKSKKRSIDIN